MNFKNNEKVWGSGLELPRSLDPQPASDSPYDPIFQKFLWGRKLLYEECQPFPQTLINQHIQQPILTTIPGVISKNGVFFCNRCGNENPELFGVYECARCGKDCRYCRACLTMGVIKECSQLLTWSGPPPTFPEVEHLAIHWNGALSPRQKKASAALKKSLFERKDFLIWAVCGAGKTEILYETVLEAISQGLRIGIVSPRTDVVIELSHRFKRIFPDLPLVTLYGDSPDSYEDMPLIISTTHQLLRFNRRFDVFFIDEVDAFPFHNNPLLEQVLLRAGKEDCLHFYLTATPTDKMKRDLKNSSINGIKIPIRFHGQPLPEPRFQWIGSWQKQIAKGFLPPRLKRWVDERITSSRPGFIFVPTIESVMKLVPLLKKVHASIEGVHSEDPQRHEKVVQFREGGIPLLVTTTILERGVTIPHLDVAVLGADQAIFDERALVQIGGRVGRDRNDPSGDLVFFHHGLTLGMLRALQHIRSMNRVGKQN